MKTKGPLDRAKAMLKNEKPETATVRYKRQAALRKLIRGDIREIYFFGRKCSKDDILRLKWR